MNELAQDVRYSLRMLARTPVVTAVAVISLALGIGANTAIFTLTDQLLLRLLPVHDPGQLVLLSAIRQHFGNNAGWNRISYPMYQDFRDRNQVFSKMFCLREVAMSVSYGGRTERISGEVDSGNYFPVLGVGAALGRVFTAEDDKVQAGQPVAVMSFGYWQRRFAGDPGVIGRKLVVNGYPYTVVGVSQAGFSGTDPASAPELRVPITMAKEVRAYMDLNDRRSRWVTALGGLGQLQIFVNGGLDDRATGGDLVLSQTHDRQPQHFADLAHGTTFPEANLILLVSNKIKLLCLMPSASRVRFRADRDYRSEIIAISVPNPTRFLIAISSDYPIAIASE